MCAPHFLPSSSVTGGQTSSGSLLCNMSAFLCPSSVSSWKASCIYFQTCSNHFCMLCCLCDKYENWWNVSIRNGWFYKKKKNLRNHFRTTKYKLLTTIELGMGKPTIKNIKNILCVWCHICVGSCRGQGGWVLQRLTYRRFWAAWCKCWEPNSGHQFQSLVFFCKPRMDDPDLLIFLSAAPEHWHHTHVPSHKLQLCSTEAQNIYSGDGLYEENDIKLSYSFTSVPSDRWIIHPQFMFKIKCGMYLS